MASPPQWGVEGRVLPFTFGLDPLQGLATMTGVYVGGCAGGLVSACLIGIPGTPAAIATTFDGFPMTRKGQPGRALWPGTWASCIGGLLGGFLSGAIGLIVTIIGADPIMAVPRLNFGSEFLRSGFQFLPVLIGIFAFAQITSRQGLQRLSASHEHDGDFSFGFEYAKRTQIMFSFLSITWTPTMIFLNARPFCRTSNA